MKKYLLIAMLAALSPQAFAKSAEALKNPAKSVLCDKYICADQNGVSATLTLKYLGKKREAALTAQGAFDKTAFTFSNGVFCDTREKQCHTDRYFDKDGKRSPVAGKETRLLFSGGDSQ
ncbi:YcgJ family protein [Serratia marcescens]|uniref:YcgJ family protein n=1 Tax=Serratia marcescens TaxID=615 RepID=UPI0002B8664B|nr:YcgJ family protein [Serratia marcescens]EMF04230.1 Fels-1 Propage domain-containing protein [Serratia marcescens VGH107]